MCEGAADLAVQECFLGDGKWDAGKGQSPPVPARLGLCSSRLLAILSTSVLKENLPVHAVYLRHKD